MDECKPPACFTPPAIPALAQSLAQNLRGARHWMPLPLIYTQATRGTSALYDEASLEPG
jgi:hypothetical protein